jgi:hypothetical protein
MTAEQKKALAAADDSDLKEGLQLRTAPCCMPVFTRARDSFLVTGVKPVSEFLDDLAGSQMADYQASGR